MEKEGPKEDGSPRYSHGGGSLRSSSPSPVTSPSMSPSPLRNSTSVSNFINLNPNANNYDHISDELSGWLRKMGAKGPVKGWKKRWFAKKPGTKIFYYTSPEDCSKRRSAKGLIDINVIEDVLVDDAKKKKTDDSWEFKIITPGRQYSLAADSQQIRGLWVDHLMNWKNQAQLEQQAGAARPQGATLNLKFDMTIVPGEIELWSQPVNQIVRDKVFPGNLTITNFRLIFDPFILDGNNRQSSAPTSPHINRNLSVRNVQSLAQKENANGKDSENANNEVSPSDQYSTWQWHYLRPVRVVIPLSSIRFYLKPWAGKSPIAEKIDSSFLDKRSKNSKKGGFSVLSRKTKDMMSSSKKSELQSVEINSKDFRSFLFALDESSKYEFFEILQIYMPSSLPSCFAFTYCRYENQVPAELDGWNVYKEEEEYQRMGVPNEQWRISTVNQNYEVCSSYPAFLCVPASVTDEELKTVGQFRRRGRIPALCWKHPNSYSTITRCSQPSVGLAGSRCVEDERMITAITDTNRTAKILHIEDARPKASAMANQAKGAGYEKGQNYSDIDLNFLDIENIHVMRDCVTKLNKMCELGCENYTDWFNVLGSWFHHIHLILAGAVRIANLLENKHLSVLIHCSDGWDRTTQLSCLAQIMLDPYYRTIHGLMVLIEKEWLSFGHKFPERCKHYSNSSETEESPVFLQFLDCLYQIMSQFPTSFQYNPNILVTLADHSHYTLFGTFIGLNPKERAKAFLRQRTVSLWTFIKVNIENYKNDLYNSESPRCIFPNISLPNLRFWREYYFRYNPDMQPFDADSTKS